MAPDKEIVFLEDLECVKPTPTADEPDTPSSSQASASSTSTTATAVASTTATPLASSQKRQRSLADMLGVKPKTSQPPMKKLKTASSMPTVGSSSSSSTTGPIKLNAIPFSMSQFIESLTEDQKRLLQLECEVLGKSWLKLLKDEIKKPYFLKLKQFLWDEGTRGVSDTPLPLKIYPAPQDIYNWSNTPLGKVKVVIIGQDPYHGRGQAHGLSFSVPQGQAIPPSLHNIYKEIKSEYPEFVAPKHGNLQSWASNGVLLLNACLTVRASQAASHSNKGWETFTQKVVDVIDQYGGANLSAESAGRGRGVVFLAWGKFAQDRVAKLSRSKHLILTSTHPSPFSAHKGFLGNGHFKKANDWLEEKYGPEGKVNWCDLSMQ